MDCNDIWYVGTSYGGKGQGQLWASWWVTLVLQQNFRFLYFLFWTCYGLDFIVDNSLSCQEQLVLV